MEVKVIAITRSLIDGMENLSAEELLIYEARVSNPDNQANTQTAAGLLRYLINKKHWSPFDMVDFTVEVKTSRAIAAQILRHWSFDFQEFSQRYSEVTEMEPVQLREAGSTTRQGSIVGDFDPLITSLGGVYDGESMPASRVIKEHLEESFRIYQDLIKAGVAKECARMILPLTTQSTLYMKASVRSWLFYLSQRLDPHAQLEHQQLARVIYTHFKQYFPNACEAFFGEEA